MIQQSQQRESEPSTWLGMPRHATIEVVVFFAVALLVDAVIFDGTRFRDASPHPFWLFTLIVSAHYGVATGVFSAVVGTLLVYLGNLPPRDPLVDQSAWLLSVVSAPVLWFVSAVVLGELRARRERILQAQADQIADLTADHHSLTMAKMALELANDRLQTAAAGQVETTLSLVQAARTVDVHETGAVFESVEPLIRNLLQPKGYSIYLRHGERLDLVMAVHDGKGREATPSFLRGDPIFDAVVDRRQLVHVAHADGERILGRDGLIAGPLVDTQADAVIGMLKVESLPISGLNQGSIQAFRMLSEWIATAYGNAQRFEEANLSRVQHRGSVLFTDAYYRSVSAFIVVLAERATFEVSQLTVRVDAESATAGAVDDAALNARVAAVVQETVTVGLRSTDLAFDYQRERGEFVIILPMTVSANCKVVANRLRERLRDGLDREGLHGRIAVTWETLYVPTARDIKPWHRAVIRRTDPYT